MQGGGGIWEGSSKLWKFMGRAWGQPLSLSLLRFSMRHEYGPIPKILGFAPGALISNLGEDRGRLFAGGGGGAYLIFPKSWPGMIIFLIHHLCIKKQHKLLIVIKT